MSLAVTVLVLVLVLGGVGFAVAARGRPASATPAPAPIRRRLAPPIPPPTGDIATAIGRAREAIDRGDLAAAGSELAVAEVIAPDEPEVQIALGDLHFAQKEYGPSTERFDRALALIPDHPMALLRRGIARYYQRDYPGALGDLTRAGELDPELPNVGTFIAMARKKSR